MTCQTRRHCSASPPVKRRAASRDWLNPLILACLLLWVAVVVAVTLAPGDFRWLSPGPVLQFTTGQLTDPIDLFLNTLLFIPFGLIAFSLMVGSRIFRAGPAIVGLLAFGGSLSLEVLQRYLPARDSSLVDVVGNSVGAILGFYFAPVLAGCVGKRERRTLAAILGTAMLLVCLLISGILQYRLRPSNWDDTFPLVIGNEHTGDRPWNGQVLRVDFFDAAISSEALWRFACGKEDELPSGNLLALHAAGGTLMDRDPVWRGVDPAPAWTTRQLDGKPWLETNGPVSILARRVAANGSFTLRVTFIPPLEPQAGPARIVSYSRDPLRQNFMVGQEGYDLVVRVRSPATGLGGGQIPVVLPDLLSGDGIHDLVITRRGSELRCALAGSNRVHRFEFTPGALLASYYAAAGVQRIWSFHWAYQGVASLLLCSALAWALPVNAGYFKTASLVLAVFPVFLEGTVALAADRAFEIGHLLAGLGVGFAAFLAWSVILLGVRRAYHQLVASDQTGSRRGYAPEKSQNKGAACSTR